MEAVGVISLTPPGISTNKAILSIIPDIIASTTTGIDAVDCQGRKRTVFIEIVGYIGDYVAVQHIQDLTGPRGLAPCPLCTFPKGSVVGATTSEYAYIVSAHSEHASFRRDKNRMRVARSACANDAELQQLGLRRTEGRGSEILPLHALSDALEKPRDQVPRTEDGKPVVSATFDPYLSSLVAPDQLFAGLGQDVINANMRLISRSKRIIAESLMKHALSANGLETEPHLYNHDKLQLHAMSISMMFNLILVAPWAIASSCSYVANGNKNSSSADFHSTDCMHLLFKFQMLVSDTLFSPKCDIDGKQEVLHYNKGEGGERMMELKRKCASYIQAVDAICSGNALAKKDLDKPNIHRLLELYNHTIPLLGHIRHGQELLFEAAHQPLKKGLKQSNKINGQLTAIDEMLANDWKYRIGSVLQEYGVEDSSELSEKQCVKLKQLLCGQGSTANNEDEKEIAPRIRNCFKPPVIEEFTSLMHTQLSMRPRDWRPVEVQEEELRDLCDVADTEKAISYLSELYKASHNSNTSIQKVISAKSVVKTSQKRPRVFERISKNTIHSIGRGDVVQAAVRSPSDTHGTNARPVQMLFTQEDTTNCSESRSCSRRFWLILDIIYVATTSVVNDEIEETSDMMAIVWPLHNDKTVKHPICEYYDAYRVMRKDIMHVLPLRESVVKVMALHICNWQENYECRVVPLTSHCIHHNRLSEREPYILLGRREGFPPRKG